MEPVLSYAEGFRMTAFACHSLGRAGGGGQGHDAP
jgi:hypothetical protein